MDLNHAVGIVVIVLLAGLGYHLAEVKRCLKGLREDMPINEWVPFDTVVKLGKASRFSTKMCLHFLVTRGLLYARPSPALIEQTRKRVERILESMPPEQGNAPDGIFVIVKTGFKDLPMMEFLLRVRPNAPRKVEEEKVEMPDFAMPQAI